MMDDEDIAILHLATNARFRVNVSLTTKNQSGYDIRPECVIYRRKAIPEAAISLLEGWGLPPQHRYTDVVHLRRLLRTVGPWREFTKDPEGYAQVLKFNGMLPDSIRSHADVVKALEVLDDGTL